MSKTPNSKKDWWCGSNGGPEFKPQYHLKEKKVAGISRK
jgi:hypothetical protein